MRFSSIGAIMGRMAADSTTPKRKRRWLQFTLRALLLVIVVVAAFLAGRASLYSRLREERERAEVAEMKWKLEELRAAEIRGEIILPTQPRSVPRRR